MLDYSQGSRRSGSSTMPYARSQTNGSSRPFGHAATQQLADKENLNSSPSSKRLLEGESQHLNPHPYSGSRPTLGSAISRSGSEADSLLDLYGLPRSQTSNGVEKYDTLAPTQDPNFEDEDSEESRWIHRDKLAIIESKELREAGIQVPLPARTTSRGKGRRQQSHDHETKRERESSSTKEDQYPRVPFEPQAEEPQQQLEEDHGLTDFDVRTPEEIAAESYGFPSLYRQQSGLRASSSRIPIARSGPIPLPQEPLERSAPLPRTRGASGTWPDEDGPADPKTRSRSQSFGSQILLDENDAPNHTPNTPGHSRHPSTNTTPISPTKPRASNNRPSTSSNAHTRQPSTSNGVRNSTSPEQTKGSTNGPTKPAPIRSMSAQRPKSRAGLETRPPTAVNRPEGEPPWLATMYKPDPRLPPDQQLLPTHAKRMQQREEAMRAAKTNGTDGYSDGNINGSSGAGHDPVPLAVHTKDGFRRNHSRSPQPSPSPQLDSPASQGGAWPLKPLTSPLVPNTRALNAPTSSNPSPVSPMSTDGGAGGAGGSNERSGSLSGTAGGGHGGYSTMPKVQTHGNGSAVGLPSPSLGGGRERSPLPSRMERREKMERPGMDDEGRRR